MNPACKQNLVSSECQEWMNAVCAHCSNLLPDARQAELWDSWWPDEPAGPYKPRVSLMSAFDCHRLRKEVAREVEKINALQSDPNGGSEKGQEHDHGLGDGNPHLVQWTMCRIILVALVAITVLVALIWTLKMLTDALRSWQSPQKNPPSGRSSKCKTPTKSKTPTPRSDAEDPKPPTPPKKAYNPPRSFIAFAQDSDPLFRYGPYAKQTLLLTNSVPEPEARSQQQ
ncbi:hypothetical protein KR018_008477, partial [Drosophila ironensis]